MEFYDRVKHIVSFLEREINCPGIVEVRVSGQLWYMLLIEMKLPDSPKTREKGVELNFPAGPVLIRLAEVEG